MTEEQLSALLRLKRFEQPPPQYFDQLLENVHRRQRAELLHRPLWRIGVERVQTFFSEHSMGNVSYAGAMAAALILGVGTIIVATPGEIGRKGGQAMAANSSSQQSRVSPAFSLQSTGPVLKPVTFEPQRIQPRSGRVFLAKDRRYVIDARPASYEPQSSIQF
jgi:hypothetical protein